MKKLLSYLFIVMLVPAVVFTGCKDNDDPTPTEKGTFETLSTYMINQGYDLPNLLENGWVTDVMPVSEGGIVDVENGCTIPDWTVFDIRSAADFALGHIPGAINVALTDIVTEANAINEDNPKILVVCYSGQTAGRAVMALQLSGFSGARVMKFGFSAWSNNPDFDKWSANTSDQADGDANWVFTASPALPVNNFPTWETTSTDGATILADNVDMMLQATGWGVKAGDVLATPSEYSIYNYWAEADYTTFGHFAGAYQYSPISLANDVITAINPENSNLVYCYTGQTSSFIVAWLQVLGYNAQSIYNGVNNLRYTALSDAGKPHWHFPYHEYEYVTD